MVTTFFQVGTLRGIVMTSVQISHERRTIMKKIMTVAVAALVALSLSATAFAATKAQTGTKTQIKSGICVK